MTGRGFPRWMFLPLPPALLLAGHGQKQLGAPGGEQGEVRSRSRAAPGLGTGLFVNPGGCRKSRVLFLLFLLCFFLEEEASKKEVASGTEGTGFGRRRSELKKGKERSRGVPAHGAATSFGKRSGSSPGSPAAPQGWSHPAREGGSRSSGPGPCGLPAARAAGSAPAARGRSGAGAGAAWEPHSTRGNPTGHVGPLPKPRRVLQEEAGTSLSSQPGADSAPAGVVLMPGGAVGPPRVGVKGRWCSRHVSFCWRPPGRVLGWTR